MKKSLLRLLFAAVFACGAVFAHNAMAQDFIVDGAAYTKTSATTCETAYAEDAYNGDYVIPETVVYEGVSYTVTGIGDESFIGIPGLTSVSIPSTVTYIGESAFQGCPSLVSVVIPSSVTVLGRSAFCGCSELRSVVIPASVGIIDEYMFCQCSKLEHVELPDGIVAIESWAFLECEGLKSVRLPDTVTKIGARAFDECPNLSSINIPQSLETPIYGQFMNTSLYTFELVDVIGTTARFKLTTGITGVEKFLGKTYDGDFDFDENGVVTFTGLTPGGCGVEFGCITGKGKYIAIDGATAPTEDVDIGITCDVQSPMDVVLHGSYDAGDAVVTRKGFRLSYTYNTSPIFSVDTDGDTYHLTDLEPGKSYYAYFFIVANGREFSVQSDEFYMPNIVLTTLPAKATSNTVALICAETNLPDTVGGTGFEWRRYDAPEEMPSSTAACPVIDGVLTGSLNNLSPSTYYKFRPYYKAESGKMFYGEWVAFITADAYVYFDPTVRTYAATGVTETTADVSATAVQGSDPVTEQGFEYWPTATRAAAMRVKAAAAPQGVQTVTATGQVMTATLEGLQPGTGYTFRAYVKTAKGTTYGGEQTFSTLTATGLSVVPSAGDAVEIARYDAVGRKIDAPVRGLNIVVMSDGSVRKVIVK